MGSASRGRGTVFRGVCIQGSGVCIQGRGSDSGGSASRESCIQWGGSLYSEGSASKEICIIRGSAFSGERSVSRGSESRGKGVVCIQGVCPTPPILNLVAVTAAAVHILLECILVLSTRNVSALTEMELNNIGSKWKQKVEYLK